jgi:2-oxoglutarate dehydrogenase E1 component
MFRVARSAVKAVVTRGGPAPSLSYAGPARLARTMATGTDDFLNGTSSMYVDETYRAWMGDPASVHKSWDIYFRSMEAGVAPTSAFSSPGAAAPSVGAGGGGGGGDFLLRVNRLLRRYQRAGHEYAHIDPLDMHPTQGTSDPARFLGTELDPSMHGITEADLAAPFDLSLLASSSAFHQNASPGEQTVPLGQFVERLRATYCCSIGVETAHMHNSVEARWMQERVEQMHDTPPSKAVQAQILERLAYAELFENFLEGKWNTAKRFGLEGGEALIPGMKAMLDTFVATGGEAVVLGMPHRGRLNVLANVMRKPFELLFKEFSGTNFDLEEYRRMDEEDGEFTHSGDVKYHLGTSSDRTYPDGSTLHLALAANPSHLEAVNPVVTGKARARQFFTGDSDGHKTMAVLLHGDAAFMGQGVVFETMNFSNLHNYSTGGTVHIVVNNQIGFTTDPASSRSTLYCTDVGKAYDCPILHVNGDKPEEVDRVFRMAAAFRQEFKKDVVIDLTCYRRFGHNELDQPLFTQPAMYHKIAKHPSTLTQYKADLVARSCLTQEEVDATLGKVQAELDLAFEQKEEYTDESSHKWLDSRWEGFKGPAQLSRIQPTGVEAEQLSAIGNSLWDTPDGFATHRVVSKMLKTKKQMIDEGANLDWATAEALAFGTMLAEGNHVRLSGQDVERGTFTHRHAVVHDQKTSERHTFLNNLGDQQNAEFHVCNSSLSEFGVLGFELGYSMEAPNQLVIWEAQFGDFVNGAQVMIDNFISCGESKWNRQSGLTMLLPHGYDGAGAEHSSCRIERFLQSSDDDPDTLPRTDPEDWNSSIQQACWQIVNCTTPAQYFHVLRRQVHRDFRKPLIVAAPKNLLRHPMARSTFADMAPSARFQRVIPDNELEVPSDKVRKLVFCSGKLYYELLAARQAEGGESAHDVALVRIEQLFPFPFDLVGAEVAKYPNAEVVYAQEEPKNMGAWAHVQPRIRTAILELADRPVGARHARYVGRSSTAATAAGYGALHTEEQKAVVSEALS